MQSGLIRIGTRGSRLALAQAHEVRDRLATAHGLEPGACEVVVIRTSGDRIRDRALADAGGKGLFTKEIEEALIEGRIDLAVHSMKDMPTVLPAGLAIAAILPREDPRDAFLSPRATRFSELPKGAVIGSASLRRGALAKHARPDLEVVLFRGNVETRLAKLEAGEVDATFLAHAGLKRLGLAHVATSVMDPHEMLPAVAQGAIGVQVRDGDDRLCELVAALDDRSSALCVAMERAFLAALDGSCRTPIAGLATVEGEGRLAFAGAIVRPDGSELHHAERRCAAADAGAAGRDAGEELKGLAGPGFFDGP